MNSKISYYFTGSDAGITLTRTSRLVDEWDPHQPDENTAYYLARLHEAVSKFINVYVMIIQRGKRFHLKNSFTSVAFSVGVSYYLTK